MRSAAIAAGVAVALALLAYTVGLGVYAVASTRPALATQPESPADARAALRALGLADAYPFASRFLDAPGGRMHYLDEGRGPVVLALHGLGTWSFLYRALARDLPPDARVVAPDRVGFGLSQKHPAPARYTFERHLQDLRALASTLDLRDATVIVHGDAAPLGLALARAEPGRVTRLLVLNSSPDGRLEVPGPARWPVVGEQLVQGLGWLPRGIRPDRPAYRAVQGNWYERAATLAALRHPAIPAPVAFTGPAQIVWGTRDRPHGPALERWRSLLPEAPVTELAASGPFPPEDAPEAVLEALRGLLDSSESVRP